MNILLIDDDLSLIELIDESLKSGWSEARLISTTNGTEAISLVQLEKPDIIILDLGLPDADGIQVLRQIRSLTDVHLIILTAKDDEMTKILGLQEGADDYITKPFSVAELVARMKALIRRKETTESRTLVYGKSAASKTLVIDFENRTANYDGRPVRIGPRQYRMLQIFIENKGKVVPKLKLLAEVFPEETGEDTSIVDVYINKLREGMGESPNEPETIVNEGDTGYKFVGSYSIIRKN